MQVLSSPPSSSTAYLSLEDSSINDNLSFGLGGGSSGLVEMDDLPNGRADLLPLALVPPSETATHALGSDSEAE